jgi:hypothetical protein
LTTRYFRRHTPPLIGSAGGAACLQVWVKHFHITIPHQTSVFVLAITIDYSSCPPGAQALAAGILLAYNGNIFVYSQ